MEAVTFSLKKRFGSLLVPPNESPSWVNLQLTEHPFKATKELIWTNM